MQIKSKQKAMATEFGKNNYNKGNNVHSSVAGPNTSAPGNMVGKMEWVSKGRKYYWLDNLRRWLTRL